MKHNPKLILINGSAGIGKSTIAQRYINEHPLALCIDSDDIIAALGQWLTHEDAARKLAFELAKSMVSTHLKAGYDVILPHLLTHIEEATVLEDIANAYGAAIYEFVLFAEKAEAVTRMMERGTWGEPGSPPLTQHDIPIIEGLFDKVQVTVSKRPNTVKLNSIKGNVDGAYKQLITSLERNP